MITTMNQRWRQKVASYRSPDEVFNPKRHWVCELRFADAKEFICRHHYMGSMSASRVRLGLYDGNTLVGAAVFDHGMNMAILRGTFPQLPAADADQTTLNLARFVLLDRVKWNGETWFLARCFEELRKKGFQGVVSFSDPVARPGLNGETFPGHIGTIYQASNATYLGLSSRRTKLILPDGREFCGRTISKVRNGEVGWEYACRMLVEHGADRPWGDRAAWVEHWTGRLCRRIRHPGNYKYGWWFPKKHQPNWTALKYPKVTIEAECVGPASALSA